MVTQVSENSIEHLFLNMKIATDAHSIRGNRTSARITWLWISEADLATKGTADSSVNGLGTAPLDKLTSKEESKPYMQ